MFKFKLYHSDNFKEFIDKLNLFVILEVGKIIFAGSCIRIGFKISYRIGSCRINPENPEN